MGIFNEHSSTHFAKGIHGAPGVGFNLTADGSYDMVSKKLRNVGTPTLKQYVDENSGSGISSNLTIDSDTDMNDIYLSYSQPSNTI